MRVVLHLGAHRTGSSSFQAYLRGVEGRLAGQGVGYWGPWRTRNGLLHGLAEPAASAAMARRATGRLRLARAGAERRGASVLLVSDANLSGTLRACLLARVPYPEVENRLSRLGEAFGGVDRAVLQIRSPESWWASALSILLTRGAPLPDAAVLARLAEGGGHWRPVIAAVARALPGTELIVTPFERFAARPDRLLKLATDARRPPPLPQSGIWMGRSPDLAALRGLLAARGEDPSRLPEGEGRWRPFTGAQVARMQEAYADDLFWLRAGADGLAVLKEDPEPEKDRLSWPPVPRERGQDHDSHEGRLAQAR